MFCLRALISQDHTISIFTSDNGSDGTKISIHRAALLSALTIINNTNNFHQMLINARGNRWKRNWNGDSTLRNTVSFASEDTALLFSI